MYLEINCSQSPRHCLRARVSSRANIVLEYREIAFTIKSSNTCISMQTVNFRIQHVNIRKSNVNLFPKVIISDICDSGFLSQQAKLHSLQHAQLTNGYKCSIGFRQTIYRVHYFFSYL